MDNNKNLTIEEVFNLAAKNHQEGKIDVAQDLYNQILKIYPNHSQTLNNIAIIFINSQEYQKAKKFYEKSIEINPNYADAHNNLGLTYVNLKDYQKARKCYEKAIELNPNYADAHYNLGGLFNELRENQKSKKSYERAIEINPDHANAYNNRGILFKESGDLQKSKNCYEKAIEINPNDAKLYNNQGNTYKEFGEFQNAVSCYKKASELNPSYDESHANLGLTYNELNDYQKAKECFEKTIKINPNHANAHNHLLKSIYKLNDQSILFKKLDSITKEGKINAVIGSIFSRAKVKYGFKKENPFCNNPLDYVLQTDLIEKYDFKNVIVDCVHNILKNDSLSNRTQTLITNGYQTAGNLFTNEDFNTKEIQRIIHTEIEKYRLNFKDSKEGFIKNWPTNYNLTGWLISLRKGGKLKAHMHDFGWLSGSIYVNVPSKLQTDSGNLVVCIDHNENEKNKKSIDVISGSLCLFPSSLLHYTIPFEAEEERVVLAFDVMPN